MSDMNDFSGVDSNLTNRAGPDERSPTEWVREESFWRDNWEHRPYTRADLGYEFYNPAYRYGFEAAQRYRGREWNDVEPELRSGWDRAPERGRGTWDEMKAAVHDAWDRVTR
jgi:hypothetical protein